MRDEDRITKRLKKLAAELVDLVAAIDAEPTNGWEGDLATQGKVYDAARVTKHAVEDRARYLARREKLRQQDIEEQRDLAFEESQHQRALSRERMRAP